MLKKAAITVVACLAVAGTAYADDTDNAPIVPLPPEVVAPATPGAIGPIGELAGGSDITIGTIQFHRVVPASGPLLAEDVEHLDVQEDIPLCGGPLCRKAMRFHLTCMDAAGATKEIVSPFYRNYATEGMITRSYEFSAPGLSLCESIPDIKVEWRYGWQDTVD
jgi:hypothetical protein